MKYSLNSKKETINVTPAPISEATILSLCLRIKTVVIK
jgi:hypothetical protein